MSKNKDPNSWGYGGVKRRDFQHTHGGPEEMPHKKKKKKVNRSKCDHQYVITSENSWTFKSGSSTIHREYKCTLCGKRQYEVSYVDNEW